MRFLVKCLMVFAALAVSAGCGAKKIEPLYTIWPPAPGEPKIVYLKTVTGGADFKESSFIDALLGKEATRDITKPYGVAAYKGRVYVTETNKPRYFVAFDTNTGRTNFVFEGDFGKFKMPIGIAVAPSDGRIFVSDTKYESVFVFNNALDYVGELAKKDAFKTPAGMAVDEKLGRIYIVDTKADTVQAYSLDGAHLFNIGGPGVTPGTFHSPTNVAIDRRNGNVAVVDTLNNRVQVFDSNGKFIREFGKIGDGPGLFTRPKGIGIDSEGHIYVTDAAFGNVQIFSDEGAFIDVFGTDGTLPGFHFSLPAGMFIDVDDTIYIVEQYNSRVQMFRYLSDAWKKANPQAFDEFKKRQEAEEVKLEKIKEEKLKKPVEKK